MAISENSGDTNVPAVRGANTAGGDGLFGTGRRGVVGVSDDYQGVFGKSRANAGVVGESDHMHAVLGITHSTFAGVYGASDAGGSGVAGESKTGRGVHGISETGSGVYAQSSRCPLWRDRGGRPSDHGTNRRSRNSLAIWVWAVRSACWLEWLCSPRAERWLWLLWPEWRLVLLQMR